MGLRQILHRMGALPDPIEAVVDEPRPTWLPPDPPHRPDLPQDEDEAQRLYDDQLWMWDDDRWEKLA